MTSPFRRFPQPLIVLAIVLIALARVTPVSAGAILFDQPPACGWGPNYCSPPYPVTNGLPTVIPDGNPSAYTSTYYTAFTLKRNALVDTVTWVAMGSGAITFFEDDGHAYSAMPPGDVLMIYGANIVSRLIGYEFTSHYPVYEFTATLGTPFHADAATQYWLSISSFGWARSGSPGQGYCSADGVRCLQAGQDGFWGAGNFRLEGTTVPEPEMFWLLAAGLMLTAYRQRRIGRLG